MNALALFEIMKRGGTVTSGWKNRHSHNVKPRYEYYLTFTDGTVIKIQKSIVQALVKAGNVRERLWFGDSRKYEVIE